MNNHTQHDGNHIPLRSTASPLARYGYVLEGVGLRGEFFVLCGSRWSTRDSVAAILRLARENDIPLTYRVARSNLPEYA